MANRMLEQNKKAQADKQTTAKPQSAAPWKETKTPSGKKAVEAYCAVWFNAGNDVALCAPTLEQLKKVWLQITGTEFSTQVGANFVWIVKVV